MMFIANFMILAQIIIKWTSYEYMRENQNERNHYQIVNDQECHKHVPDSTEGSLGVN